MGYKKAPPALIEAGKATRFKPGQSGNPGGVPIMYRGIHRASYDEFMELLKHLSSIPPHELKEWGADKTKGSWELGISKALIAVSEGDFQVLFLLMDRMYGKPRDASAKIQDLPLELLLAELKRRYELEKQTVTI